MKINLGQIATGAMQQYLKDDDARIKTEEERRIARKKFQRDKELLKVEYDFRDRNAWKKEGYEAKNATVELGDQAFHYPVDQKYWSILKDNGFEKLWQNEKLAKRTGTAQVPKARLTWANVAARKLLSKPELIEAHPDLVGQIFSMAERAAFSGDAASLSRDDAGNPIMVRMTLENLPDLKDLANMVIEKDSKSRPSAEALVNFFYKKPLPINVVHPEASKVYTARINDSNIWSIRPRNNYIPQEIYSKAGTALQDNGMADSLRMSHFDIGRQPMKTEKYRNSVQNFMTRLQTDDGVDESIKTGALRNGRRPSIFLANAASSSVMFLSNYNYFRPAKVYGGQTWAPTVPKADVELAEKAGTRLDDHITLTYDLDRMIQINESLEQMPMEDKGLFEKLTTRVSLPRELMTKVTSLYGALKDDIPREIRAKIDKGLNLKEIYTGETIKESGITGTFINRDGETENLQERISKAIEAADGRITDLQNRGATAERIRFEKEYAHLKIRTIFGIAKVIQGGTGGRGVSNLDFEFVARSLAQGPFSTLEQERISFQGIRDRTIREYIRNRVTSNQRILGSKRKEITEKSYNLFRTMENMHKAQKDLIYPEEIKDRDAETGLTPEEIKRKVDTHYPPKSARN